MFKQLRWMTVYQRAFYQNCILTYKVINGMSPSYYSCDRNYRVLIGVCLFVCVSVCLCVCKHDNSKYNRPYSRRPVAIGIFRRICPRSYCPIKTGFLNKNDWFLTVFLKTESQRRPNYRDKCINYFRTVY